MAGSNLSEPEILYEKLGRASVGDSRGSGGLLGASVETLEGRLGHLYPYIPCGAYAHPKP